jgi:hypothetical protein
MDELMIRVLTRLLRVHDELGPVAFENAAHRALVSIAQAVQFEADRKAGTLHPAGNADGVVPFPLATSQRALKQPPPA